MTDHRRGQSYSHKEVAEAAKAFHAATDIAPYALRHHFEVLDIQGRTPDQTLDVFLNQRDTVPVIKTGPETGTVALCVLTFDEDTGLYALAKEGLFCFCNDPFMEVITTWDNDWMSHHMFLYRSGNRTFPHWIFESLPGVVLWNSGEIAPVCPGYSDSCHPMCPSVDYAYGNGRDYATYGIPDLPTKLIDLLELEQGRALHRQRAKAAAKSVKLELFDPISKGSRNHELTRRAGYLIGRVKMSEEEAREVLLQINDECCQPPLCEREVANIARSISRRHARHG